MSNLSFIKRIDDLGRIVIPKEIRRILKIDNNENMEISINNEEIILKKHSLLSEDDNKIINVGRIINGLINNNIVITNRDKVIYSNNNNIFNKEISSELKEIVVNRYEIKNKELNVTNEYKINTNFLSKNIIIDSDSSGIIIIYGEDITERDKIIIDIASKLLNS